MPAQFTGIFAERLNRYSSVSVKQAEEGDPVVADRILIAPGGQHMRSRVTHPGFVSHSQMRPRLADTDPRLMSCFNRRLRYINLLPSGF